MGTRADFYVGRGEAAEWLGSIAWDGYPGGVNETLRSSKTEGDFRAALTRWAAGRDDWTDPDMGWPWPWETSRATDYAYAFDGAQVWGSCFGDEWWPADQPQPKEDERGDDEVAAVFPDMTKFQKVTLGNRSGGIIVSAKGGQE